MYEQLDTLQRRKISIGLCPDCGGVGFLKGPEGGLCVNIMCANPSCGSRFNTGPLFSERISEPSPNASYREVPSDFTQKDP
jgi:hypothetical protein